MVASPMTDIILLAASLGAVYEEPIYSFPTRGGRNLYGRAASLPDRAEACIGKHWLGGGRARERKLVGHGIQGGRSCDSHGRWAVECIVDVRYPVARRGMQLDVLVRWAGRSLASKQRWPDEWKPISLLSKDLIRAARDLERERLKRPVPPAPSGDRQQPIRAAKRMRL